VAEDRRSRPLVWTRHITCLDSGCSRCYFSTTLPRRRRSTREVARRRRRGEPRRDVSPAVLVLSGGVRVRRLATQTSETVLGTVHIPTYPVQWGFPPWFIWAWLCERQAPGAPIGSEGQLKEVGALPASLRLPRLRNRSESIARTGYLPEPRKQCLPRAGRPDRRAENSLRDARDHTVGLGCHICHHRIIAQNTAKV